MMQRITDQLLFGALILGAASVVCLAGCGAADVVQPETAAPAGTPGVKIGETTRAEIYAMFGTRYVEEDGPDVIYYSADSQAPNDEVGVPCYRCPAEGFGARITFRDEVVVQYQLVRP